MIARISGRDIATIQWEAPVLETFWGKIHTLELADQRPDGRQIGTWDHVEVYFGQYDTALDTVRTTGRIVNEKKRPHHTTHQIDIQDGPNFVFTRDKLIDKARRGE